MNKSMFYMLNNDKNKYIIYSFYFMYGESLFYTAYCFLFYLHTIRGKGDMALQR